MASNSTSTMIVAAVPSRKSVQLILMASVVASTSLSTSQSSIFSTSVTPSTSTDPVASSSSAQQSFSSSAESSVSSVVSSAVSSAVSSSLAAASSARTTTVEPLSTNVVTSVVSASSQPGSTQLITSVVTNTPSVAGQSSLAPVTVVVTSVYSSSTPPGSSKTASSKTSSATSSASSGGASLQNNNNGSHNASGGLSAGGKTAVAVVVPVVVVALLVVAGLFFWRKRKQRKTEAEARRKEVEEYGFNPNNDPTLPVIAQNDASEMAEDHSSGYRGWGNAGMSNRKASTTLSGGHTAGHLSDTGSNPGAVHSPSSPPSDGNSGEGLVVDDHHHPGTMSSDDLAALGTAPVAGAHRTNDIRRGPSNASSSYSAGNRSDNSDGNIAQSYGSSPDMYSSPSYGYTQPGPYGDGTYGGGVDAGMPIVRDVSARRNTRIEAGGSYQQGNSGIAQNF